MVVNTLPGSWRIRFTISLCARCHGPTPPLWPGCPMTREWNSTLWYPKCGARIRWTKFRSVGPSTSASSLTMGCPLDIVLLPELTQRVVFEPRAQLSCAKSPEDRFAVLAVNHHNILGRELTQQRR